MEELINKMDDYCIKTSMLNMEMHKVLVKFVKKAGGEIILDYLSSGNDALYAFVYNEELSTIQEYEVDKVRVVNDDFELHIPDVYIESEDRVDDEKYKWYSLMGGMVLINATIYNLCEVLPTYVPYNEE